jgi:hypothetical protein
MTVRGKAAREPDPTLPHVRPGSRYLEHMFERRGRQGIAATFFAIMTLLTH